ncbi:MAG: hypothetical protein ACREIA_05190 [Opitutaceae bacterium]
MSGSSYDYTLNSRCVAVVLKAGKRAHILETLFSRLAAAPFTLGDYRETDASGRVVEVLLHEEWLVTFWTDHAVKMVNIVDVESVG